LVASPGGRIISLSSSPASANPARIAPRYSGATFASVTSATRRLPVSGATIAPTCASSPLPMRTS